MFKRQRLCGEVELPRSRGRGARQPLFDLLYDLTPLPTVLIDLTLQFERKSVYFEGRDWFLEEMAGYNARLVSPDWHSVVLGYLFDESRFIPAFSVEKALTPPTFRAIGPNLFADLAGRDLCRNDINPTCELRAVGDEYWFEWQNAEAHGQYVIRLDRRYISRGLRVGPGDDLMLVSRDQAGWSSSITIRDAYIALDRTKPGRWCIITRIDCANVWISDSVGGTRSITPDWTGGVLYDVPDDVLSLAMDLFMWKHYLGHRELAQRLREAMMSTGMQRFGDDVRAFSRVLDDIRGARA